MLAVARAIVEPRALLLIDEPSKGLAPSIINNLIAAFSELKRAEDHDPAGRAELHDGQGARRPRRGDGRRPRRAQRPMAELADDDALQQRLLGLVAGSASMSDARPLETPRPLDGRSAGAAIAARPSSTGRRWRCWPRCAASALPLIGSPSTWVTLTVAGLAMGMIVFIIASGLTLVFGLMDVLNFGHGVFIALGAFVATSVMGGMADWTGERLGAAQPGGGVLRDAGRDGRWPARSAWPSSASSCGRCTAST